MTEKTKEFEKRRMHECNFCLELSFDKVAKKADKLSVAL